MRRAIGAAYSHPLAVRRFAPTIKRLQQTVVPASNLAVPPLLIRSPVGHASIREIGMTATLSYRFIKAVGEEISKGNAAFEQLEQLVDEHIHEGWRPIGGVAVSAAVGPKGDGSLRDHWFVRVAQAVVREK
jgi:hypothetical protein